MIKTASFCLLLCCLTASCATQTMSRSPTNEVEAKIALRELVDTFSLLADRKEAWKQTELFTENARVVTYANGAVAADLTGRQAIGSTFDNFLKNFDVVYHFNGQHVVALNGNRATGQLYCVTWLFSTERDKKFKTTIGVRYNDEYQLVNGHWLISKRTSYFEWQTKEEVKQ
jgi:hypothetical protein